MREFLTRAKREDNDEWVEGYLYRPSEKQCPLIMCKDGYGESHEVDPGTVGGCIGLFDRRGMPMFEGDICKVGGEKGLFAVGWDAEEARFTLMNGCVILDFGGVCAKDCEVVGNVHDDRELWEGGNEYGEDD